MFLCLVLEHSVRVSIKADMHVDLPVPGGPATIIPTKSKIIL